MQEWLNTILLGVIEGITEFLPISSTGHLIIIQDFLNDSRSEFFNVGIQSGAVLAVVLIYWRKLIDLGLNWQKPEQRDYILKLSAAFTITAVLGLTVKFFGAELPQSKEPVAWAVLIGALAIFAAESVLAKKQITDDILWKAALIIGAAQVLAGIFPGTSRSAATIIAAMLLGVSRVKATEFSFLLGIPTMFAAGFVTLVSALKEEGELPKGEFAHFVVGFLVSMIVAFIAVKWLLGFIQTHTFTPFAWYRLVLGLGLLGWIYL
ncbi:MAG: undecaprenyl-diphosphate phosphatase [Verrucomicrobiota bacterium]